MKQEPDIREDFSHAAAKKRSGLMRLFKRLAIGTALGFALIGEVQSAEAQQAPPQPGQALVLPVVQVTTEMLKAELARTPRGKELLEFMNKNDIKVAYSEDMADWKAAIYDADINTLTMRPSLTFEQQVWFLAHEMRHAWQDIHLDWRGMEAKHLTPVQRFTLRRFLEADARSFASVFEAERRNMQGGAEPSYGTTLDDDIRLLTRMRLQLGSKDGLTDVEYRHFALEYSFGALSNYNDNHFTLIKDALDEFDKKIDAAVAADAIDGGREFITALREDFTNAPSEEAFTTYLRRFGGLSLDPAAATTLKDIPANTLYNDWPRRENDQNVAEKKTEEIAKKLAEFTQRYQAQERRVLELIAAPLPQPSSAIQPAAQDNTAVVITGPIKLIKVAP